TDPPDPQKRHHRVYARARGAVARIRNPGEVQHRTYAVSRGLPPARRRGSDPDPAPPGLLCGVLLEQGRARSLRAQAQARTLGGRTRLSTGPVSQLRDAREGRKRVRPVEEDQAPPD